MELRRLVFILLCVVTFLVPWEEMLFIPGFGTVIFAASGAALALAAFEVLARGHIKRLPVAIMLLAVFAYWSLLSYLWSADPDATLVRSFTYVSLLLFVWMIWEFVDSRYRRLWLLRSYILGCCFNLVLLFESYLASRSVFSPLNGVEGIRYEGGMMDHNTLALILGLGIIFAAYLAIGSGDRYRAAYWAFVPVASIAILLTGSRSGAMGLLVSLGVAFLISGSRSVRSVVPFLLVVGIAAWFIPDVVPVSLIQRVTEGTGAHTFVLREEQWQLGLQMWGDSPFTGVGAGAFVASAVEYGGRAFVAHNTFVQILTDYGLVGSALIFSVWCILAARAWRLPGQERLLWLGAGLAWAVAAVALSLEYAKITWFLYAWVMVEQTKTSAVAAVTVPEPEIIRSGPAQPLGRGGTGGVSVPEGPPGAGRYGEASWN